MDCISSRRMVGTLLKPVQAFILMTAKDWITTVVMRIFRPKPIISIKRA